MPLPFDKTEKFSETLELNFEGLKLKVDVDFTRYTEYNYNADADGNRGCKASFREDLKVTCVQYVGCDLDDLSDKFYETIADKLNE